eukprot:TRINITY_DN1213_c0_g1_i5.p1 TRINITY_DN1213_c0_g1~~TRINITY_DN1213_c0_g1_i5.p1  ORF type:complete len:111 (-),score=11.78 TRINITY_DN1213_c0_g1_i5:246-578(-)
MLNKSTFCWLHTRQKLITKSVVSRAAKINLQDGSRVIYGTVEAATSRNPGEANFSLQDGSHVISDFGKTEPHETPTGRNKLADHSSLQDGSHVICGAFEEATSRDPDRKK